IVPFKIASTATTLELSEMDWVALELEIHNPQPHDRLIVVALDSPWVEGVKISVAGERFSDLETADHRNKDSLMSFPSRSLSIPGEQSVKVSVAVKQTNSRGANIVVAPYSRYLDHQSKLIATYGMLFGSAFFALIFATLIALITKIPYLIWYCGYLIFGIATLSVFTGSYSVFTQNPLPITVP